MSFVHTLNGIASKTSNKKKQKKEDDDVAGPSAFSSTKIGNDKNLKTSIVDPIWETLDPTPDVHALFQLYNDMFFQGALAGCEVKWSPRMTTCAGVCSYEGIGGLCSIRLSKPLLVLRTRKDCIETLLHEMIHAYLFVTVRNRDRDAHGPEFQLHMHRINARAGTSITIYHTFFAEVANYKQHWWRCEGPCRTRRPFYGWVKRASNRAPGPNDLWWAQHQQTCGGKFIKVKEPEGYGENKKNSSAKRKNDNLEIKSETKRGKASQKAIVPVGKTNLFSGEGFVLGGKQRHSSSNGVISVVEPCSQPSISSFFPKQINTVTQVPLNATFENLPDGPSTSGTQNRRNGSPVLVDADSDSNQKFVMCPVCTTKMLESFINSHLDQCLT